MMRPPLFICFSAACVAMNTPRTLISSTRSISSSVVSSKRFRNGGAGIVYKDVEAAEGRHGLFDRGFAGVGISGVRLNRDRLSALAFNLPDDRCGRVGTFRVCDGHLRPVCSKTFGDCGTNAARAASNECNLSFQFPSHCLSPQ